MRFVVVIAAPVVAACGPGPSLELWVDSFRSNGGVGVARVSVIASDAVGGAGEGDVALRHDGVRSTAPLVAGQARFELSCPALVDRCTEPVRLEASWNGLVTRHEGRLSKSVVPAAGGSVGGASAAASAPDTAEGGPRDAGASAEAPSAAADAGSRAPAPPLPAPQEAEPAEPTPWDAAFHPGVDVEFVVTFASRPPTWGAAGGAVSLTVPMTTGWLPCPLDEAGRCTLRALRPGRYEGSLTVWYGGATAFAAVSSAFDLHVPWTRTRLTVPLSSP
jgi:hypothetical protein